MHNTNDLQDNQQLPNLLHRKTNSMNVGNLNLSSINNINSNININSTNHPIEKRKFLKIANDNLNKNYLKNKFFSESQRSKSGSNILTESASGKRIYNSHTSKTCNDLMKNNQAKGYFRTSYTHRNFGNFSILNNKNQSRNIIFNNNLNSNNNNNLDSSHKINGHSIPGNFHLNNNNNISEILKTKDRDLSSNSVLYEKSRLHKLSEFIPNNPNSIKNDDTNFNFNLNYNKNNNNYLSSAEMQENRPLKTTNNNKLIKTGNDLYLRYPDNRFAFVDKQVKDTLIDRNKGFNNANNFITNTVNNNTLLNSKKRNNNNKDNNILFNLNPSLYKVTGGNLDKKTHHKTASMNKTTSNYDKDKEKEDKLFEFFLQYKHTKHKSLSPDISSVLNNRSFNNSNNINNQNNSNLQNYNNNEDEEKSFQKSISKTRLHNQAFKVSSNSSVNNHINAYNAHKNTNTSKSPTNTIARISNLKNINLQNNLIFANSKNEKLTQHEGDTNKNVHLISKVNFNFNNNLDIYNNNINTTSDNNNIHENRSTNFFKEKNQKLNNSYNYNNLEKKQFASRFLNVANANVQAHGNNKNVNIFPNTTVSNDNINSINKQNKYSHFISDGISFKNPSKTKTSKSPDYPDVDSSRVQNNLPQNAINTHSNLNVHAEEENSLKNINNMAECNNSHLQLESSDTNNKNGPIIYNANNVNTYNNNNKKAITFIREKIKTNTIIFVNALNKIFLSKKYEIFDLLITYAFTLEEQHEQVSNLDYPFTEDNSNLKEFHLIDQEYENDYSHIHDLNNNQYNNNVYNNMSNQNYELTEHDNNYILNNNASNPDQNNKFNNLKLNILKLNIFFILRIFMKYKKLHCLCFFQKFRKYCNILMLFNFEDNFLYYDTKFNLVKLENAKAYRRLQYAAKLIQQRRFILAHYYQIWKDFVFNFNLNNNNYLSNRNYLENFNINDINNKGLSNSNHYANYQSRNQGLMVNISKGIAHKDKNVNESNLANANRVLNINDNTRFNNRLSESNFNNEINVKNANKKPFDNNNDTLSNVSRTAGAELFDDIKQKNINSSYALLDRHNINLNTYNNAFSHNQNFFNPQYEQIHHKHKNKENNNFIRNSTHGFNINEYIEEVPDIAYKDKKSIGVLNRLNHAYGEKFYDMRNISIPNTDGHNYKEDEEDDFSMNAPDERIGNFVINNMHHQNSLIANNINNPYNNIQTSNEIVAVEDEKYSIHNKTLQNLEELIEKKIFERTKCLVLEKAFFKLFIFKVFGETPIKEIIENRLFLIKQYLLRKYESIKILERIFLRRKREAKNFLVKSLSSRPNSDILDMMPLDDINMKLIDDKNYKISKEINGDKHSIGLFHVFKLFAINSFKENFHILKNYFMQKLPKNFKIPNEPQEGLIELLAELAIKNFCDEGKQSLFKNFFTNENVFMFMNLRNYKNFNKKDSSFTNSYAPVKEKGSEFSGMYLEQNDEDNEIEEDENRKKITSFLINYDDCNIKDFYFFYFI